MGLPTVTVLLDDGSNTFPHDITDKVFLNSGFSLTRGRGDWEGAVTAGTLSLTLNNSDGRFSPGSTTIATPSPIVVDQQIRLVETVNGIDFTRFTGYVKAWPVGWPATVSTHSTVSVEATDAQARAERRVLRSVIEEEILSDGPSAYFVLNEPEGSASAADTSGNQAAAMTMAGSGTAVVFGATTGPGTDGIAAATFSGGQYLSGPSLSSTTVLECAFSRSGAPATAEILLSIGGLPIGIRTDGRIATTQAGDFGASSVVTDGATHVLSWQSGNLLLDGVNIGSPSWAPAGGLLTVGGMIGAVPSGALVGANFTGAIAHVAAFTSLSTTRGASHATAVRTGFAGESGTTRLTRLAGYADLPVGTLDPSLTNMSGATFDSTQPTSVAGALDGVGAAEAGAVFFDGSGELTFHNRERAAGKSIPDLVLDKQWVSPDVEPVLDDQQLLNYLEASSELTQVTQVVRNTASEASHGRYLDSKTYPVQTDVEVLDRANWTVAKFAEPTIRYGALTINLYGMTAAQQQQVIQAVEINCWLRVTNMPSQNPTGSTVDVVVQGFSEEQSATAWVLRCNVVARTVFEALIVDDPVYGAVDNYPVFF